VEKREKVRTDVTLLSWTRIELTIYSEPRESEDWGIGGGSCRGGKESGEPAASSPITTPAWKGIVELLHSKRREGAQIAKWADAFRVE